MPLPLVPIAIAGAVAAAGALAVIRPKVVGRLDSKTVAILGSPQVGKTTLLEALEETSSHVVGQAHVEQAGKFTLTVEEKTIDFTVKNDVPGDPKAKFTQWKEAYDGADVVLYLFRADLIGVGDASHIQLVKGHLNMLKEWSDNAGKKVPRIVLVGTWADQSPMFERDAEQFTRRVQSADPIKLGRKKFKRRPPVVVGSLVVGQSEQFIADLAHTIV